jgi:hypothetical protein
LAPNFSVLSPSDWNPVTDLARTYLSIPVRDRAAWTREARRGAVFGTFFDFSREFLGSYSAKDLSATATPVIIVIVMPLPAGIHRKAFATHQSGIDTTF